MSSSPTPCTTRNAWLAAYLIAHGVRFLRAVRLEGPTLRIEFELDDSRDQVRMLTRRFLSDMELHAILHSRRCLAAVMDRAARAGVCEADEIGGQLDRAGQRWAEQVQVSAEIGIFNHDATMTEAGPDGPGQVPCARKDARE